MTQALLGRGAQAPHAAGRLWRDGRVWLASAAILALVALLDPAQGRASLLFTADALLGTAPFLLMSVAVAAYAGASGADSLIARAFTGSPVLMVVLAALVGALSPFCSCGVIPLVAALLAMGVPLAPVMAFWLASPIMDPSMFALTLGVLGPEFARGQDAGRGGARALRRRRHAGALAFRSTQRPLARRRGQRRLRRHEAARAEARRLGLLARGRAEGQVRARGRQDGAVPLQVARLGLRAGEPDGGLRARRVVAGALGGDGLGAIALATLVGVPAYLNGYAALPLVSGLVEQGMAPGAGLAFLVAGGVSSLPAAIAVWALARPPVFALYLVLALVGSFAAGLLFQAAA